MKKIDREYSIRSSNTILLSFLLLFSVLLTPYTANAMIRFEHFSIQDGLSDNTITAICQDSKGFMWFGTTNGLNRFDGYNYVQFKHDPGDSLSISDNYIRALFLDSSGSLWIGTLNGGLNRFNSESESFTSYMHDPDDAEGISNNSVTSITEGHDGLLWVGTSFGLNALDKDNETFKQYLNDPDDPGALVNNNIGSVLADTKGNIWIGTQNGLCMYSLKTDSIKHMMDRNAQTSELNQNIINMTEGANGVLWLSTWGGGLRMFDTQTESYEVFQHDPDDPGSLSSNVVGHMSFDKNEILWFGSPQGIHSLDPATMVITHYSHDPSDSFSISNDSIWAVYHDRSGILWIGTLYGGGNKVVPSKSVFNVYHLDDIYSGATKGGYVDEFHEIGSHMWLGSNYGFHSFDPERGVFSSIITRDSKVEEIAVSSLRTIYSDDSSQLWLGMSMAGLVRFDVNKGTFTKYSDHGFNNSVSTLDVTAINRDKDGLFWVGTQFGILAFDPKTESFNTIGINDKENTNLLGTADILFDSDDNRVWISGPFGLALYERNSNTLSYIFSNFQGSQSLSSNFIYSLLDDGRGSLWLGTNDGLYSYEKDAKTHVRHSLPNDYVAGLIQDNRGNVWACTNVGVSCIKYPSMSVNSYDAGDGLPSDQNMNLVMYGGKDGSIYVGGQNGFYTFLPEDILANSDPPELVITSFKVDNVETEFEKSITETTEIALAYSKAPISFEFSALDFANPESNEYAYKMEGLNDDWSKPGNERKVNYTNLAPGSYVFKVKAANSQGTWNNEGTSLKITIIPPFWKTLWFKFLVLFALVMLIYSIFAARVVAIKRQREQLRKLVDKQTEDIRRVNEKLQKIAVTDELTQINNRRSFNRYISSQWKIAIREKTQVSLVLGDIDYFKKFNDNYGHQEGDDCLFNVAQILKNQLKRPKDFIARYGGEEFVLVLPGSSVEGARVVARHLIEGLRKAAIPHEQSEVDSIVTISLGIASIQPDIKNSPETITKMADDALYKAKNQGRNQAVVFSE